MSKHYGILAYPAKHSLSPVMHNAAFKALKIDAKYGIIELKPDITEVGQDSPLLKEFFKEMRTMPIDGISVSLPFKEAVIPYLDKISPDSERIGAVNTITNKNGILMGGNTDFAGAVIALNEVAGTLKGKKVVVVGAGGAARAVAYGLLQEEANVVILNRTKNRAVQIAMEFAEMFKSEIYAGDLEHLEEGDILINTSSIWNTTKLDDMMLPSFCNPAYVAKFSLVMDIAYKPFITPLLEAAQFAGVPFITGDRMLLYQAAIQFEVWTGKKAPLGVMEEALVKALMR